jgi:hypothetical protein
MFRRFRIWSVLLVSCCASLSIADDDSIDAKATDTYERGGGFLDELGDEKQSTEYSKINGFRPRPSPEVLNSLNIEWQPLKRDVLGNVCYLQGRLITLNAGEVKPIDWFQGLTVAIAIAPATKLDWSRGIDQELAVGLIGRVRRDGTFQFQLDLSKIQSRRDIEQSYQIGIVLAEHEGTEETQTLTWNLEKAVLPATVQMVKLLAAPRIDRELELINDARKWQQGDDDAEKLIRAVNALRPLGKEKALQTLEKYLELHKNSNMFSNMFDDEIIFWIIRLLFEPARLNDRIPEPGIAVAFLEPKSPAFALWPIGPLVLINDVPFFVGTRCGLGGLPEQPTSHIEWVRRFGVIREKSLLPAQNPLENAEHLIQSERFKNLRHRDEVLCCFDRKVHAIRTQALGTVSELLKPLPDNYDASVLDKAWKDRLAEAKKLQIAWDEQTQRFVSKKLAK